MSLMSEWETASVNKLVFSSAQQITYNMRTNYKKGNKYTHTYTEYKTKTLSCCIRKKENLF